MLGNDWEHFSAVCFFFGRRLADHFKVRGGVRWLADYLSVYMQRYFRMHLCTPPHHQQKQYLQTHNKKVPVGLVASAYGGTPIISWSSPHAVAHCNATTPSLSSSSAAAAVPMMESAMELPSSAAAGTVAATNMRLRGPQRPQQLYGEQQPEPEEPKQEQEQQEQEPQSKPAAEAPKPEPKPQPQPSVEEAEEVPEEAEAERRQPVLEDEGVFGPEVGVCMMLSLVRARRSTFLQHTTHHKHDTTTRPRHRRRPNPACPPCCRATPQPSSSPSSPPPSALRSGRATRAARPRSGGRPA